MKRLFACAAVLASTGCVSVLPQPVVPEGLYTFGEDAGARVPIRTALIVREPDAPKIFAGKSVASVSPAGAVRIVPGVEWSDTATRLMQTGLLDLLEGEGAAAAVSSRSGASGKHELAWRMADFTLSNGTATVELEVTLLDARTRTPITQASIATQASASDQSAEARIQALGAAARAALRQTAEFVAGNTSGTITVGASD